MSLEYVCRYCNTSLGRLEQGNLTEAQLGFDQLTPEEREDIITNSIDGNQQVNVVCESCQQMLEMNPERLMDAHLFH